MATAAMARTLTETVAVEPTLQMRLQFPNPPQAKNLGMMNNKLRNRLRLDPTRALEPARKKIATIEAQRVMSVFEDTILKSEIITLMPFIVENLERFRITFGTELSELIEHHAVILNSYDEIKQTLDRQMKRNEAKARVKQSDTPSHSPTMSTDDPEGNQMLDEEEGAAAGVVSPSVQSGDGSRPQSKQQSSRASSRQSGSRRGSQSGSSRPSSSGSVASNFSMDSQMERTVRSLTMVAQQLNTSCKNVLRAFQLNPSAMNTIKHEYSKRGIVSQDFIKYMNELKDVLLNKLLTTPEEEKERMEYLQEISKRERNNAAIIEKLETELKAAQDDKDEDIKKKNDVIRGLQADLRQIQKFSEDHIRRVNAEADKQKAADKKNSEGRKQRLQQEVTQLQTQQQNLVTEHRENEQELRKKKFKIETEVENWIQRYDQDMGERQDEYEEIDTVYTEEKKQLHELEERFKTLEAEYQQIMEERRLARERREAAERELALMVKASTTIQAFWRSFKVRKALKARKKKGGKKKK
ncbi:dynein regulatory complex protein 10-like [Mercenaria mercenaria]|uniref:dynein regulatory complex protein 10-like n=1 Tax=Mercenaria mercenaria TaxID=6596 RepID=UPI00234ED6E1|nr:dynein regulatory complex protein 10-like [Mercenaria mercenaria]